MSDGRPQVRRSKTYPWSAPETGYPFYGRWDIWIGTVLTAFALGTLVVGLVPVVSIKVAVGLVALGAVAETSRAALGIMRADRVHRRRVADNISEEIGIEVAVRQLADLYGALHRNSGALDPRPEKRVTDTHTAADGSRVTLLMFRDETVKAVREQFGPRAATSCSSGSLSATSPVTVPTGHRSAHPVLSRSSAAAAKKPSTPVTRSSYGSRRRGTSRR